MKVVIDTNVVISRALSNKGAPARIIEQWVSGAFELVISEDILAEYQRALGYEHIRKRRIAIPDEISTLLSKIKEVGTFVVPDDALDVISRDPDDNKFLECAIAGGADYIVSGDAHLLNVGQYEGIQILSPATFLTMLNQQV
ncbi:MAG TPA: putative toxin-antitoxin system toxin component, PIN family [Chloroflexia bacterium]|nr:putative toxin-antitoxin system toxin component, PIN family [Chloroflexia bacterium]